MAITAKPSSYSVNTGHAKCPDHLWMLDEASGTSAADIGKSSSKVAFTLDNAAIWGTDTIDGKVCPCLAINSTDKYIGRSATLSLPATSIVLAAILKTNSTTGTTNEIPFGIGSTTGSTQRQGYIRGQPQVDNKGDTGYHDGSILRAQNTGLIIYDQTWKLVAAKFKTNYLALSIGGVSWSISNQTYTYPVASGDAPNRFTVGRRPGTETAETSIYYFNGKILALMAWDNLYDTANDAWISSLYSDPWQFLNLASGSPLNLPHRSAGGMLDLSGNFRG